MERKAKLVNIISMGHSGSTLLDFLIGSIPGTFSTGELVYFPWQLERTIKNKASIENQYICTCGKDFFHCNIWGNIITDIEKNKKINLRNDPFSFDISLNRSREHGKMTFLKQIYTSGFHFFSKYGLSGIVTFIYSIIFRKGITNNWLLFDLLKKETGAEYIVDSTKDPIRFRLLRSFRPKNVKLIILVREIQGVAASGTNYGRELDLEKSVESWLRFYNIKVYNIVKKLNESDLLIVKYEDITKSPQLTINKIAKFLNLKVNEFENFFETKKYHIIAGNPMRYKENFSIRYDERWKKTLTKDQVVYLNSFQEQLSPFFKE